MKHFKIKLKSTVKFSLNGFETISYGAGTHTVPEDELKIIKSAFAKSIDGKPTETAAPESNEAMAAPEIDLYQRVAVLEEQATQQGEIILKLSETVEQLSAVKEADSGATTDKETATDKAK